MFTTFTDTSTNTQTFVVGDMVALDDIWEVKEKRHVVANACGIGEYEYDVFTLQCGTTKIDIPEWMLKTDKTYPLKTTNPIVDDDVLKVEYTKGYNKGYYDAYEKIIKQLICDNQINKQILDITK